MMKKIILVSIVAVISMGKLNAQITTINKTTQPVSIKQTNTATVKNFKTTPIRPGSFAESTPAVFAPTDATKNSAVLYSNTVSGALSDDAKTTYYFLDNNNTGKDKLLKIATDTRFNSIIRMDKSSTGNLGQVGAYQFPGAITLYDELLFGNFSPEEGATFLVNDKRANVFWHYQHNSTNYMLFERPYSMLSNWQVADRYLTGDFNGDGKSDLLGWNFAKNEFQVALYTKNPWAASGPGSLEPAGVWLTGWAQTADMNILTGDFNGDKKDDIALVHQPTGEWWVAISTGTGFQATPGYKSGIWLKPWAVGTHHKIAALDVNNDGKCDLVEYDTNEKSFQAVLSNGQYFDYFFKREYVATAISNPEQVVIGKFSGNCMIAVAHLLPPDNYYVNPRRAMSVYLTSYQR